ncbi:hypothetical protein FBR02_15350 [Anaerolineae bacterium CFX9]|nr:hypothetical protein [Anaerolineae bacterium CFX9]
MAAQNSSTQGASFSSRTWGAYTLIGVGTLVLLTRVFNINIWNLFGNLWQLFIILPGALMLAFGLTGSPKRAGLLIPGAIVTGTGVLLFVQDVTNNWQSWAYAWALYPVFIGIGMILMSRRTQAEAQERAGRGMVMWGALTFTAFMLFFELFIFGAIGGLSALLVAALLIGGGALLLRGGQPGMRAEKRKIADGDLPEFPAKPKRGEVSAAVDPALQRQIDEALYDGDARNI